ncbi:MAG: hypothetical protein ACFE8F_12075 [Promethearchaeota archaeon]
MKKAYAVGLLLLGLLIAFSPTPITRGLQLSSSTKQLPVYIDLVPNWDFAEIESGGWDGNDHNASKPTFWYFTGDTTGPKEQYRIINDTANGGDVHTLFLQPTHANQEHTVMFWQDFTTLDINQVSIQYRSCATGPTALILLYGLNASITPDTPLPNGTIPYLTTLHPSLNETPGYWSNYTTATISLSNLPNTYHHYRIHWQLIEAPGKPDAQLYITYCRVTGPQLLLPLIWPPIAIPIIGLVAGIIVSIIMLLVYLKKTGKLHLPKLSR